MNESKYPELRKDKNRAINVKGLKTCGCGRACDIDDDTCSGPVESLDKIFDADGDHWLVHRCQTHKPEYLRDKRQGTKKFPY